MKRENLKIFAITILFTFLSTNAHAEETKKDNFFKRTWQRIVPVHIDQDTQDWLKEPGVKAQIYSPEDQSKYIIMETESDGKMVFKSCECGPSSCFPMQDPLYRYTSDELTHTTSTFKGIVGALTPIGIGVGALVAGALNPAALGGAFTAGGQAINPQGNGQEWAQRVVEQKQLAKSMNKNKIEHRPAVELAISGDFKTFKESYLQFLVSVKDRSGTKEEKAKFREDRDKWEADVRKGTKPGLKTCESEQRDDTKKILSLLENKETLDQKSAREDEQHKTVPISTTGAPEVQRGTAAVTTAVQPQLPIPFIQ
jgi:hypothetical protein